MSRCVACRCEASFARSAGAEPPDKGEDLYAYAWCMGAAFIIGTVLVARRESDGSAELRVPLCEEHQRELDELVADHGFIERTLAATASASRNEEN